MGCEPSKPAVIRELRESIHQIKQENLVLENQKDRLKLQQELKSDENTGARDSINNFRELLSFLKAQLQKVKQMGVMFLPPTIPDVELFERTKKFKDFQVEIEEKYQVIYDLRAEIFEYNNQIDELEFFIDDYNKKLDALDRSIPTASKQIDLEQNYYKHQIFELEQRKHEMIKTIQEAEVTCKKLSDEIIAIDEEVKDANTDAPTYEFLLTLSKNDLLDESKKIDKEIDDLTEHLKYLKQKEVELEEMNNYILELQNKGPSRIENLRKQADENRERVQSLIQERDRLREDVDRLKLGSPTIQTDNKLQVVNNILEEKALAENNRRAKIAELSNIEDVIQRAKNMTSSIKSKSVAFTNY